MDIRQLMEGLAAGDALGVTSEFQSLDGVRNTYLLQKSSGWPFAPVGGGPFGFRLGQPTDDAEMARAIVEAWIATSEDCPHGAPHFDGARIATNFVQWLNRNPRDIGIATRATLQAVRSGEVWWKGGRDYWHSHPHAWSNGSLMRNGVVAGMGASDYEVFRHTLLHGLITHWAPLPAICCAAQNWLIRNHEGCWDDEDCGGMFDPEWKQRFQKEWEFWLNSDDHPVVRAWHEETKNDHEEAWKVFVAADFNPDTFRPFAPIEHIGFCLTTLQIGVWAMQWARRRRPYPSEFLPEDFPTDPFLQVGSEVLGWVAMIGRDSDTYGATAGPMITVVDDLRPGLIAQLRVVGDLPQEIPSTLRQHGIGVDWNASTAVSPPWNEFHLAKLITPAGFRLIDKYESLKKVAAPYSLELAIAGAPADAIAHVSHDFVVVAETAFQFVGSHELVLHPIPFATKRLSGATETWLLDCLSAAAKRRQASYVDCDQCGERHPPECGDGGICQRCMEENGVRF